MKLVTTSAFIGACIATSVASSDARRCGGGPYNDARRSCDGSLLSQRGYHDNPHRHRPSTIDLVSDLFSVPFYHTNTLFRQQQDQLARLEQNSAPRYSISMSDDGLSVELSIEVPGVAASDLTVEVENGSLLHVHGTRTIRESGSISKTEFDQSFQLGDVDVDSIDVSLSDGILTVIAPKKKPIVRRIPFKIHEHRNTRLEIDTPANGTGTESDGEEAPAYDNELTITEDESQ
jgi:HSP20 family molecular chaperone IbpA